MVLNIKKRPGKRHGYAIPLVLLASLFTALMATIVKMGASEFTGAAMVFWRNLISLVVFLPWLVWGTPHLPLQKKLHTTQWKLHLVRGFTSFLSVYLYYVSLQYLDLTNSTVLFNTIPIFIPIIALIWHRIAIHHRLWWAIGLAFIGIILVLDPTAKIFNYASLLALLSGIVGAISLVSLRIGHYTEPSGRMLFYLFVVCIGCSGVATLFSVENSWEHLTWADFKYLIPIGIFGFLYQICMTIAAKFATIRFLSPFLYTAVVFTFIFDKILWHTAFSMTSIIGILCVIAGAFLMLLLYPKEDLQIRPK